MSRDSEDKSKSGKVGPGTREARLKAALKANLARRKAQTRARAVSDDPDTEQNEKKD